MRRNFRFRGQVMPQPGSRASVLAFAPTSEGDQEGVATLRLYDPIDSYGEYWGVSAKEFAAALAALPTDTQEIRLHINSPGGEVFEAVAILNQLRQHRARVVAIVDGIAASAASFLAAGADETIMAPNSTLMVHDAWGICVGNAADMRDLGDLLDKLSDNIASIYSAKAGGSIEDWRSVMLAEAWFTADEAVAAGLADSIDGVAEAEAENAFDLSQFRYAGRAEAPPPLIPKHDPSAAAAAEPAVSPATVAALVRRLNLREKPPRG